MSKPVKKLIADTYRQRFKDIDGAVVIDICGLEANDVNHFRSQLATKDIRVNVVKNTLAKQAVQGTAMEGLSDILVGPSTLVYGGASVVDVARELLKVVKEVPALAFKGALMEGQHFGPDQIKLLSEYPTKEEAQAQALQLVLSPGRKLAGQIVGPGSKIASILKTIEEKLEKGEAIKAA